MIFLASRLPALLLVGLSSMAVGMSSLSYPSIFGGAYAELLASGMASHAIMLQWSVGGAMINVGSVLGGLTLSSFANAVGKTNGIFIGDGILVLAMVLQSLAAPFVSIVPLALGRIVYGFSKTVVANLLIILVKDIAPDGQKAAYNHASFAARFAAVSLQMLLGFEQLLGNERHWPWLLIIPALVAFPAVCIGFAMFVRTDCRMHSSCCFIHGQAPKEQDDSVDVGEEPVTISLCQYLTGREYRKEVHFVLFFASSIALGGGAIVQEYITPLIRLMGVEKQAPLAAFVAAVTSAPAAFSVGHVCDRWGTPRVLKLGLLATLLVMAGLAALSFVIGNVEPKQPQFTLTKNHDHGVMITGAVFVCAWFVVAHGFLMPLKLMIAERSTPESRVSAFCLFAIVNNLVSVVIAISLIPLEISTPGSGYLLQMSLFLVSIACLWVVNRQQSRTIGQETPLVDANPTSGSLYGSTVVD